MYYTYTTKYYALNYKYIQQVVDCAPAQIEAPQRRKKICKLVHEGHYGVLLARSSE